MSRHSSDQRRPMVHVVAAVVAVITIGVTLFPSASSERDLSDSSAPITSGDRVPEAVAPTSGAPGSMFEREPWIRDAVCVPACGLDAMLTISSTFDVIQRLEASVLTSPEAQQARRLELEAWSACAARCPDRMVSDRELTVLLWKWLGSAGAPLIEAGLVTELAVARSTVGSVAPSLRARCPDQLRPCLVTLGDLQKAMQELADANLLHGLDPESPVGSDLVGVGPYWSAPRWRHTDLLCTDQNGDARYGYYTGTILCVSPELDAVLRRDVALHELAHYWQRHVVERRHVDEAEADCWAALHGATWFSYEPRGCTTDAARHALLLDYGRSLGLDDTELGEAEQAD